MKALCWHGKRDVRVERVPDPRIINPSDAVLRVTSTAICGSDLHLFNGFIPTLREGDILGHEFMGEVVDVGRNVKKLAVGDRVVTAFNISCGSCWYCQHQNFSLCDNSNPNAVMNANLNGFTTAGLFVRHFQATDVGEGNANEFGLAAFIWTHPCITVGRARALRIHSQA